MKTLFITILGLITLNPAVSLAKDSIRLIGSAGYYEQCELILKGDYEQDEEGFGINKAAIKNRLTNYSPLPFDAYISNNGHNWFVSLGTDTLKLTFDKELNIEGYTYTVKGKKVYCDLRDAEVIADF